MPKELHRPAFPELFESEKILISEICKDVRAVYDKESYYGNEKTVNIVKWDSLRDLDNKILKGRGIHLKEESVLESSKIDLKYLTAILNSKLTNFYFQNILSDGLNVFPDNVRNLKIIKILPEEQKPFIEKADLMLKLNREFYEKKDKFLTMLKSDTGLKKVSKKLDNFYLLDWIEFEKEIQKQKIILKGNSKDDWFDRFEKYKKELSKLKEEIDKTDKEIDKMVYELYGLSDEDIGVVEEVN